MWDLLFKLLKKVDPYYYENEPQILPEDVTGKLEKPTSPVKAVESNSAHVVDPTQSLQKDDSDLAKVRDQLSVIRNNGELVNGPEKKQALNLIGKPLPDDWPKITPDSACISRFEGFTPGVDRGYR